GTQPPKMMSKNEDKQKPSKLSVKRKGKKQKKKRISQFQKEVIENAWFNSAKGYHLTRTDNRIEPNRGFLVGLEHPLTRMGMSIRDARRLIKDIDAEIKYTRRVQFDGAFAGQCAGDIVKCGGSKWLVTSSPKLVEPVEGQWPHLKELFETLIVNDIARHAVYSWIKTQWFAIKKKRHSSCPILILAGDAADGKTMLMKLLTTLRGGRETNPIQAWIGDGAAWNDHLVGCECLNIDDSVAAKSYKVRQKLATKIKEAIFAGSATIDKRNHDSFTLSPQPVWGITIAVNATSDSIKTIPAIDGDDMAGKVIIIRTRKANIYLREKGDSASKERWDTYESELPHFLYWLLNVWKLPPKLPEECRSSRSGALIYLDPEAMTELHRSAPAGEFEELLLTLREQDHFANQTRKPLTTAKLLGEIRNYLPNDDRIPRTTQSAGAYLGQIAKRGDGCIECVGEKDHSKLWAFREIQKTDPF
ncbi:hypothetical protein N9128_07465, partial [Akkermansiaceae bacterium]|nr:hypothetical protein [Akkermansiaceae bacterium]